ncbi:MAG: Xaa-Pro peptidase family protein [Chloroflexi bacterium]|nr:Xaa-Pro peptidase family protein [Chloroflexota bacterium]
MSQERLAALRMLFEAAQIDGLLVANSQNRRYLSGFTGSAGLLIIDAQRALLISDGRYTVQAAQEASQFETITRTLDESLYSCVGRHIAPIKRLGFEPATLSVADYNALRQALPADVTLVAIGALTEQLRAIKSDEEVAALRQAINITDQALAAVKPMLRPSMLEREVAWELHKAIVEHGGDGLAFEIIVGAGLNSALPHYHAGNAPLGQGQPIVVDFGALYAGYHGDMTRTLVLGQPDAKFDEIYGIVRHALADATNGITANTTGKEADALARDVIEASGYGEYFSHGTGHGVGLQIHEEPRLSRVHNDLLPVGSIFSIEPGIYLPDWGGVRLENLVLLNANGIETLTQSPLDPIIVIEQA